MVGEPQSSQLQLKKIKDCFNTFKQRMEGIIPPSSDKETIRELQEQVKQLQRQLAQKDEEIAKLKKNI
jgi:predicted RNase H-like nuclease (RuvC/YqgF family)